MNDKINLISRRIVETAFFVALFFLVTSCESKSEKDIKEKVAEWDGKEIVFPLHSVYTIQGEDTVYHNDEHAKYKILTYVDTTGCTSCKLQLAKWKNFISKTDSISGGSVDFLFYLFPKNMKELFFLMKRDRFTYPVCIDEQDSLNLLNNLPIDDRFHTFLLDEQNRVIAIGNPIHNLKIKELFLKIIEGDNKSSLFFHTRAVIDKSGHDFEQIKKNCPYTASFKVRNIGNSPLKISDYAVSCDCIQVEIPNDSIAANDTATIIIKYQTDKAISFEENIQFFSNSYPELPTITIVGEVTYN
jgi:hypothetical protein